MDCNKVGKIIRKIRLEKGLTQKQLGEILTVSDQAISKWERGNGLPDISLLSKLSDALGVSVDVILAGEDMASKQDVGNLRKIKFYICPTCGNITMSTGDAQISCCGRKLKAQVAEKPDSEHELLVEQIEDDWYVTAEHPMEKEHYLGFVALVTDGNVNFFKQYPEWNLELRIPKRGHGKLIWYCTNHGLFSKLI